MALFTAIAGLVSLLVGWLVTIRLFRVSRRTGAAPERLLSIAFGGLFCVGYPMGAISRAPGLVETNEGSLLFAIGMIGIAVGIVALNRFPQVVFRPGKRVAAGIAVFAGTLGVTAAAGCAIAVAGADTREEMIAAIQPWAIALLCSIGVPFLWNGIESSLYYVRMRRRLALGLAEPTTTHRFLLWALASWAAVVQLAAIGVIRGSGLPILSPLPMSIIACSSLVTSACWWLAFFTPELYRTKVLGDAPATAAPRD